MGDTCGMPRQLPRPPGPDEWAARRVRHEREQRGWSTAELARRVTEEGVLMRQSSVWDIENRTPPRRITLGEALALVRVFGLASVSDLASPPYASGADELAVIVRDLQQWRSAESRQAGALRAILERYERVRADANVAELAQAGHDTAVTQPLADMRRVLADAGTVLADALAAIEAVQDN